MKNYLFIFLIYSFGLLGALREPLIYLTWQHDPTTTMTIQWITSSRDRDDRLIFAKEDSYEWNEVAGSHEKMPRKEPYLLHRVELLNLQPNSIYRFRIGSKEEMFAFRTMPETLVEPVRFVMGGDALDNSVKRFCKMTKQAAKSNPHFAIIGGDIAYATQKNKESFDRWLQFFTCWMKEMRDEKGCLIPLFVTIGNHEVVGKFNGRPKQAKFYYALFGKSYYDFGFGEYAHFTFLDSSHTTPIKGKQTKWLKKALKGHQNYLHRFAVYHVGAYPSTRKFGKVAKSVRKCWLPLFEKYQLNACFESHDHAYKRTHPMHKGKVNRKKGIVYLGDGSWGAKPRKAIKKRYLAKTKSCQQVLVVELSPQKRTFRAIDIKGKVIDRYEQAARV